jgi:hemerythrin HHE cation binding domain-containing protein
MKRSPALTRLSRDHHHGLAVALQLRRTTEESAPAARDAFLTFWHSEGALHFRVEEEVLLPGAAAHVPPDHAAVARVLSDHAELRRRAASLDAEPLSPPALRDLGELLAAHIRHEERTLFPMIEEAMPAGELGELGRAIEAAERGG